MKRLHFAVGLLAALACSGLEAQTRLEANIPFEFHLGKTTLPAGDYLFDYSSRLLVVHQEDGQRSAVMATTPPVSRRKAAATGIVGLTDMAILTSSPRSLRRTLRRVGA